MIRRIVLIAIAPIIIFGIFYPGILANTFLYYINGSSLKIGNYTINFPLTHWALFSESKNGFFISGRKVDSVNLEATIHRHNSSLYPVLTKLCDNLVYEKKQLSTISLNIYTCVLHNKNKTYFQTLDNKLVIETHSYIKENKNIISEFDLLLSRIKKN